MRPKYLIVTLFISILLFTAAAAWAAHPLITDDTGTQGPGRFQLEMNGQYGWQDESMDGASVKTRGGQASAIVSYGVKDNIDLVATLPYLWSKVDEDGTETSNEKGLSDTTLEVKWRFFEKKGFSLALKPGIIFPTGNEDKGLGAGRIGGHLFLIATQQLTPFAFHANLGYIRNENKTDEQKNIWHASLASTWEVVPHLNLVANIGIERNPDDAAKNNPAFLIGGAIYSVRDNFDIDGGLKYGLTSSETDWAVLAGITLRF